MLCVWSVHIKEGERERRRETEKERGSKKGGTETHGANSFDSSARASLLFSCLIYIIYICSLYGGELLLGLYRLWCPHSCLLSRWLRSHVEFIVDDSFPATLPGRSPISSPLCFYCLFSLCSRFCLIRHRQPCICFATSSSFRAHGKSLKLNPLLLVYASLFCFIWDTQQDVLNQFS